jgi:hypothetical protein
MHMTPHRLPALNGAVLLTMIPAIAQAYSGPGVGLGAIGVVLGIVGSVFLMTVSLIWYPVKRLIRGLRQRPAPPPRPRDSKA